MSKFDVLSEIKEQGILAVVRAESLDSAKRISTACLEGGIKAIELTFTVDKAHHLIESLSAEFPEMLIGAGTVLDPETARIAILSGARYVVSPSTNIETIRLCNRYNIPCMAGIMSPTEAVTAMEAGADILKIFPAELFGPSIVKAFKGPLPQAHFIPTGGVSIDNVAEWMKAGAFAVGVGGSLTAGAKTGDYASITRLAKEFVRIIRKEA